MSKITIIIQNKEAIEKMAALTGRNVEDVVGDSLALYEHLLNKRIQGHHIFTRQNKKDAGEMKITTFENAVNPK